MTYCGERTAVNHIGDEGIGVTLRCKSWYCEDCAPMNKWRVKRRAKAGKPTTFITLTSRHREGGDENQAAKDLVRAWRLLRERIVRQYNVRKPAFIAVFERTAKGWPHLHILTRLPFVSQKWLSQCMAELNDSPIVDIRKVKNRDKAVTYVCKYLAKSPQIFRGCKRYWTSLDWLTPEERADHRPRVFDDIWIARWGDIHRLENDLIEQGFATERTRDRLAFWSQEPVP